MVERERLQDAANRAPRQAHAPSPDLLQRNTPKTQKLKLPGFLPANYANLREWFRTKDQGFGFGNNPREFA
jgi:hypothetical protein